MSVPRRLLPLPAICALLAGLAGAPVSAAPNPCRAACRAAKRACVQAAAATFVAAKSTCLGIPKGPARRACVQPARAQRVAEVATCRAALKTCKAACGPAGSTTTTVPDCNASHAGDWLATVNLYRGLAGLPPVTEDPALSQGDLAHAQYMVLTDTIGHTEDPADPHYSDAGNTAAGKSNVAATSRPNAGDGWAVDAWMRGPFHAVGVLDPKLAQSGFGIAHDSSGAFQTAAALDVLSGRIADVSGLQFPVVYPGDGMKLPLDRYDGTEQPDPLANCPGYVAPTGPPLMLLFDPNAGTAVQVSPPTLTRDGAAIEACAFGSTDPTNPLTARRAFVIMPREPLRRGSTYQASLTFSDGQGSHPLSWSFMLACP
jgi:uncharacterized protein YkwD